MSRKNISSIFFINLSQSSTRSLLLSTTVSFPSTLSLAVLSSRNIRFDPLIKSVTLNEQFKFLCEEGVCISIAKLLFTICSSLRREQRKKSEGKNREKNRKKKKHQNWESFRIMFKENEVKNNSFKEKSLYNANWSSNRIQWDSEYQNILEQPFLLQTKMTTIEKTS